MKKETKQNPIEKLLLDQKEVQQLTGLSIKTLMREKTFPRPVKFKATVRRWRRSDIECWITNLEHDYASLTY